MAESDANGRERSFTALPKPETDEPAPVPERRRSLFELPEGALAIFFLLILAAVSGGLIAVYWPWVPGGADSSAANDRLAALETRVGQIATGQAPKAAAASFQDVSRNVSALKDRIDADEARLMALEKTTGAAEGTDVSTLKTELDKNTADLQQTNGQLAKLEHSTVATGRLDAADKAVQDLRKDLDARAQSLNDSIARLETRIAALEKIAPPADLAQRLDNFALKTDTQTLDARIASLEAKDVTGVMQRAASLLAVTSLARATQSERPFLTEFNAVKALMPSSPQIAELAPYAATGVPTSAMLQETLERKAGDILFAARGAKATNWLQRLWSNLAGLVTVRRIGEFSGDDPEARLARAQDALKSGNLDRATAEISALKGPAANAAAAWLKDAKARASVDHAVAGLSSAVVLMLAAPIPATPQQPGQAHHP